MSNWTNTDHGSREWRWENWVLRYHRGDDDVWIDNGVSEHDVSFSLGAGKLYCRGEERSGWSTWALTIDVPVQVLRALLEFYDEVQSHS